MLFSVGLGCEDVMNIRDRKDGRQIDKKQPKQITEDKCPNFPIVWSRSCFCPISQHSFQTYELPRNQVNHITYRIDKTSRGVPLYRSGHPVG